MPVFVKMGMREIDAMVPDRLYDYFTL